MPTEPITVVFQPLQQIQYVGILLLALSIFFRFRALAGLRQWNSAITVRPRSFENTDPAVNVAARGCLGGVQYLVLMILCIICFLAGIDFVIFNGDNLTLALDSAMPLIN